jgi:PAS domain S-box-containing protein
MTCKWPGGAGNTLWSSNSEVFTISEWKRKGRMSFGIAFIDKLVSPEKPRGIVTRYGAALVLPLISLLITQSVFPADKTPLSALLVLAIVCAAVLGGIQVGFLATAVSVVINAVAHFPLIPQRVLHPKDLFFGAIFAIVGTFVSVIAGSIGALSRRLEIERRKLAVTLACIGDGVVSTDLAGKVIFMNPSAEKSTGWNLTEAAGKRPEDLFQIVDQKTRALVENPIRKVLESGASASLGQHTLLIRRDGSEIPISDSAAPILDAQGTMLGTVMVFRDITSDVEREAAWLQTQRLASVGRLAATIAHEINNPLQATANLLFLIGRGNDLSVVQGYASAAAQELLRASEIAQQTLSFVRSSGERESVSVGNLLDEVVLLHRNKLKNKNIEVLKRYAPDATIEGRKGELRQVFGNLIGNALDALQEDGRLFLRARCVWRSGRSMVEIVVADTGSGIAQEHLSRIYEPFFTTKKDVGTGLGLWVVKKIVDSDGGSLRIRSRAEKGTVVRVLWPATRESKSASRGASIEPDALSQVIIAMQAIEIGN